MEISEFGAIDEIRVMSNVMLTRASPVATGVVQWLGSKKMLGAECVV